MSNMYTTADAAVAHRPDSHVFDPADVVPEMAYLNHTDRRASIEGDAPAVRVGIVDDDTAQHVPEGDEIPLGQPQLNERLIYTRRIAFLTHISRDQYRQAGTDEQLAHSVGRAMVRKADQALLTQPAPVAPEVAPSTGLVNLAGASRVDVTDDLDPLHDLLAQLEDAGAEPDSIVVSPTTWAALKQLKKADTSHEGLLGAGTDDSVRRLLSLPISIKRSMEPGTGLVLDRRAVASAYGDLEVDVSHEALFSSVGVAVRALFRAGHVVPREERVGVFYLPASVRTFRVEVAGAEGGTFTLAFRGRSTSALAYNANAATVKAALVALDDGFDADDWSVTSSAGALLVTTPGGTLAGNGSNLTGVAPSLTVTVA